MAEGVALAVRVCEAVVVGRDVMLWEKEGEIE